MSEIQNIIEFINFSEQLKKLKRFEGQVFWRDYKLDDFESVADHTWRMALILVVLEPKLSQPIDLAKALKMVLIHDLPEIICGDLSPLGSDGTGRDSHAHNQEMKHAKYEAEKQAAEEIFAKLGPKLGDNLMNLWLEFEVGESYEAKVVAALDKLEGKMQALSYLHQVDAVFSQHKKFSVEYGADLFTFEPILADLAQEVGEELVGLPERAA